MIRRFYSIDNTMIKSKSNKAITLLKSLMQHSSIRKEHRLCVLEGHRTVLDAVTRYNIPLHSLYASSAALANPSGLRLISA